MIHVLVAIAFGFCCFSAGGLFENRLAIHKQNKMRNKMRKELRAIAEKRGGDVRHYD